MQGRYHLLNGELDSTRSGHVALDIAIGREEQNLTLLSCLRSLRQERAERLGNVSLLAAGVSLLVSYIEVDALHLTLTHLDFACEVQNLHLLLVIQFTVGGLHVDVAELLVSSQTLLTELCISFLFHTLIG